MRHKGNQNFGQGLKPNASFADPQSMTAGLFFVENFFKLAG